jgi:hypothetical protein
MKRYIVYDKTNKKTVFVDNFLEYSNQPLKYIIQETSSLKYFPFGCRIIDDVAIIDNKSKILNIDITPQYIEMYISEIRQKRNEILSKTDFYMLPDININKEKIIEYRKYLRNLLNDINNDPVEYYNIKNMRSSMIEILDYETL